MLRAERLDWSATWLAARKAVEERRWKDAAEAYGELIDLDWALERRGERLWLGSLLEHLLIRGSCRIQIRELAGAKEDFIEARALALRGWGEFFEPALFLGKTYAREGNTADAESAFAEVHSRSPEPTQVRDSSARSLSKN